MRKQIPPELSSVQIVESSVYQMRCPELGSAPGWESRYPGTECRPGMRKQIPGTEFRPDRAVLCSPDKEKPELSSGFLNIKAEPGSAFFKMSAKFC